MLINRLKKMPEIHINKKIPLLTLDQRWHSLFPEGQKPKKVKELEEKLNKLIREQGQINNDFKEYTLLKKKMLSDIMSNMNDAIELEDKNASKLLEQNKKYINEINDKLKVYDDQLEKLPEMIHKTNEALLKVCANICYDRMQTNHKEINKLQDWIEETKQLLKNNIIKKQEKEDENAQIYAYMHDLLGYEIINLFDKDYGDTDD